VTPTEDAGTPAACAEPFTPGDLICSATDLQAIVVGTWLLCAVPSVFGTNEAGLEVNADGQWYKLIANPDGTLSRASGNRQNGTWIATVPSECAYDLVVFTLGGDGGIDGGPGGDDGAVVTLSPDGNRIHMNNNGVFLADYVRVR
jgi:hypothetical protein